MRQVSFRITKSPLFGTMRCLCTDRWCHFNWCKSRVVASVVDVPDLQLALTLSCGLIVRNGETGGVDDFHDEARASLIPSYVGISGEADHAHTHLLRRAVLRNPRSQWRKGGANQRGGLPRLSMEWAHRVSSDAVCRSICSERSQGSAPHQRDASRSFDMRKGGGKSLPPIT